MSAPNLYPLNDLAFLVTVRIPNAEGKLVLATNVEIATLPTAFLAVSNAPDAQEAHATLTAVVSYTGKAGKWLIKFDGESLDPALLETLFASTTPYCVVIFQNDIRVTVELAYLPTRAISVES